MDGFNHAAAKLGTFVATSCKLMYRKRMVQLKPYKTKRYACTMILLIMATLESVMAMTNCSLRFCVHYWRFAKTPWGYWTRLDGTTQRNNMPLAAVLSTAREHVTLEPNHSNKCQTTLPSMTTARAVELRFDTPNTSDVLAPRETTIRHAVHEANAA